MISLRYLDLSPGATSLDSALRADLSLWSLRLQSSRPPTRKESRGCPAHFFGGDPDAIRDRDIANFITTQNADSPSTAYRVATVLARSGQLHVLWARIHLFRPGIDPVVEWSTHPRDLA